MSAALALLIAGRLVIDAASQRGVHSQSNLRGLITTLPHASAVAITHCLSLLPLFVAGRQSFGSVFVASLAIATAHVLIEQATVRAEKHTKRQLLVLLARQLAHVVSIAAVVLTWRAWLPISDVGFFSVSNKHVIQVSIVLGAYAFAANDASDIVAVVLAKLRPGDESSLSPVLVQCSSGAGHIIGILERLIVVTLVWQGEWGAVGFVLTAKSVARFKEMENREFAEVYLVGTLTSFLVACGLGIALAAGLEIQKYGVG